MTSGVAIRQAGTVQGVVLLLPATLVVMATAALAPDLPQLFRTFGHHQGAKWLVPMVLTLPSLCMIVFGPLAGFCGDRFGRRRLLIGGLIGYALLGLAPLILSDLTAILITRLGVGIGEAFALTLSTTLIGDYFEGKVRDRWLGYQTAVTAVAAVALIAVGGVLGGSAMGWRGPFAIYVAPLLFALLILLLTWEPARFRPKVDMVATAFPWKIMAGIWPITLFAAVMFYVVQLQSSVALDAKGLKSVPTIGLLIALSTLATVAGTGVFRAVVTWPSARLLAISFACVGAGYVGVAAATDVRWLTAALALSQFGCGILLPTLLTWTVRNLDYDVRGRGLGLWQGVFCIGQFISPLTVTVIGKQTSGILATFGVLGMVNLAAALLAGAMLLAGLGSRTAVDPRLGSSAP